jgi:hypothetical protein
MVNGVGDGEVMVTAMAMLEGSAGECYGSAGEEDLCKQENLLESRILFC